MVKLDLVFEEKNKTEKKKVKTNKPKLTSRRYIRKKDNFSLDNEYYTKKEDVEKIVELFYDKLKGKKLYLPCDTKESQFYKVLKKKQKELDIEIILNDGDFFEPKGLFRNDEKSLFNKCDIVITNPPFSLKAEFQYYINLYDKDFILIFPKMSFTNKRWRNMLRKENWKSVMDIEEFIRPNGDITSVNCGVYSSFTDIMGDAKDIIYLPHNHEKILYDVDGIMTVNQYTAFPEYEKGLVFAVSPLAFNYVIDKPFKITGEQRKEGNSNRLFGGMICIYK